MLALASEETEEARRKTGKRVGVCERYPKLRFGFLESGGGWMTPWLDRMDRHYNDKGFLNDSHLKLAPSEYFQRQCWISFEPVEGSLSHLVDYLGANKILWATDYPHPDGFFPGSAEDDRGEIAREHEAQSFSRKRDAVLRNELAGCGICGRERAVAHSITPQLRCWVAVYVRQQCARQGACQYWIEAVSCLGRST